MANDGPNWEGLLKWSVAHSDGTQPPRNLSDEDRRWFMEAMQAQSVDVVKRMKEITQVMQTPEQVLESQGVTPGDVEDMLDELHEHVESIDMANDLHSIGGLVPLLGYLKSSHANIRAKAADVVSAIVQNNTRSQQIVMEANGLEPLLSNFTADADVNVRTKALGAISSLIRNNEPGTSAFRLTNGYRALKDALDTENVRFQRRALNLIHYLLHENSSDCKIVRQLGFSPILIRLASSEDMNVREAALWVLLELASEKKASLLGGKGEDDEALRQVLQERIKQINLLAAEDLGGAKEESELLDSLWKVCFNETSSLQRKGVDPLPGEEEMPPDVASQYFEPPLRALATSGKIEPTRKDDSNLSLM